MQWLGIWRHGRRQRVSGWAQEIQREITGTVNVWAPKRYNKLYLIMSWRSKSGSWWAARRGASWRVVDEREDEAKHLWNPVKTEDREDESSAVNPCRRS